MANVERLRKLRQRILDHKEQFRYTEWGGVLAYDTLDHKPRLRFTTNNVRELKELLESYSCNTCGCVAGHACMQAIEENDPLVAEAKYYSSHYIGDIAVQYLDLQSAGERKFLFMGAAGWHLDFPCSLPSVEITRATINDAIERLDVLIDHYSK